MPVVGGFSPTPTNPAYSSSKNEVARYVKMPNDTEALSVCADGILDAIRYFNARTWKWNLIYQDITLVAGTPDYSVANAVKEPRAAELLDSNGKGYIRLSHLSPKSFLTEFPDRRTSGRPSTYTAMNIHDAGQVSLNKPPDSSFVATYPTLRFWYFQRIQHPSSDGDVIDCPSEVYGAIMWKAKAYVASIKDPQKYDMAVREFNERWVRIQADNSEDHDWME